MAPRRAEAAGPAGATPSSRQLPRARGGGSALDGVPEVSPPPPPSLPPASPPAAVLSQAGRARPAGDGAMAWRPGRLRGASPERICWGLND